MVAASATVSVALGEVDRSKLASPEFTAWTSTGEEPASNEVVHADVPVWLSESQVSVSVVQPAMSVQLSPLLVEYWKSTVPVGALGLSDAGRGDQTPSQWL